VEGLGSIAIPVPLASMRHPRHVESCAELGRWTV
jgi:hypothetical protein